MFKKNKNQEQNNTAPPAGLANKLGGLFSGPQGNNPPGEFDFFD